jgi:hypothetical protein
MRKAHGQKNADRGYPLWRFVFFPISNKMSTCENPGRPSGVLDISLALDLRRISIIPTTAGPYTRGIQSMNVS